MSIRILVADDEPQLLASYRDCFSTQNSQESELHDLGASLFDDSGSDAGPDFSNFDFEYVSQGEEAVRAVERAQAEGRPFAAIFLDMRMPPGIDGQETARRIRAIDPDINIAVVTGFSDHSPFAVAKVAGPIDKLFYISKPFNTIEIQQLALSLAERWLLERKLEKSRRALAEKVDELETANTRIAANEAHARHLATHDQLTRLPNRLAFSEFVKSELGKADNYVAVAFLDLDQFKNVNDTLGHAAGDEVVRVVAERLTKELAKDIFVARLGGDEFAIAITGPDRGADEASQVAERALHACSPVFEIMGTHAFVGASVGVADNACGEFDLVQLMRRADLALYAAKRNGRNCVRWFDHEMDESAQMRAKLELRLREAIANESLSLQYQPIVSADTGQSSGYEALLRWTDEELGAVPPSLFVPVAEQCGLAKQLGEWVMRSAIKEASTWEGGSISINISTHHFQSRDLVRFIQKEVERWELPISRIQLEITESAMFADPEMAADIIKELRRAGIRVALDDFGTGYSSLVNLRDFEIDCIKIDKSFVDHAGADKQTSAIINSVTALARMLGLNVVAEGVETEDQVHFLRALGCGLMQGFYYSPAISSDELPFPKELLEGQHHSADELAEKTA